MISFTGKFSIGRLTEDGRITFKKLTEDGHHGDFKGEEVNHNVNLNEIINISDIISTNLESLTGISANKNETSLSISDTYIAEVVDIGIYSKTIDSFTMLDSYDAIVILATQVISDQSDTISISDSYTASIGSNSELTVASSENLKISDNTISFVEGDSSQTNADSFGIGDSYQSFISYAGPTITYSGSVYTTGRKHSSVISGIVNTVNGSIRRNLFSFGLYTKRPSPQVLSFKVNTSNNKLLSRQFSGSILTGDFRKSAYSGIVKTEIKFNNNMRFRVNGITYKGINSVKLYNLSTQCLLGLDIYIITDNAESYKWILDKNKDGTPKISLGIDGHINKTIIPIMKDKEGESFSNSFTYKRDDKKPFPVKVKIPTHNPIYRKDISMIGGSNNTKVGDVWGKARTVVPTNTKDIDQYYEERSDIYVNNANFDDYILLEIIISKSVKNTELDLHMQNINIVLEPTTSIKLKKPYMDYDIDNESPIIEDTGVKY